MIPPATSRAGQQALHERCRHPSGAFTPFERADAEQSVGARFAEQAQRYPDRVAVAGRTDTLTYGELDRVTNRLANALVRRGPHGDQPVALLFEHGSPAIVGILGALKAGVCHVFLDPTQPRARLAQILDDADATTVVTSHANRDLARRLAAADALLDVDTLDGPDGAAAPVTAIGPDTVSNLLYTSGSTGQPKGVVHTHRNVLSMVGTYTNVMHVCAEDRVTLLASCTFNMAMLSMFGALLNGASVHPFDVRTEGAAQLPAWIREREITVYHSVATLFRQLLDALPPGSAEVRSVRAICLGGEATYRRDVERFRTRFDPRCVLLHGLGSTELSMVRMFFVGTDTELPDSRIPVGYAIPDRDVLVVDAAGTPAPPGTTGEMVFRSPYLALGYWRQPDLTRQAFSPDPDGGDRRLYRTGDLGCLSEDGCLTHMGREDFQVKIRGHRVELGEVEVAMLELGGVREAAVTARDDASGAQQLVGYVVANRTHAPSASALRAGLAERLPEYMVPAAFVILDALPRTHTGKVDRLALPAPPRTRPPLAQPPAPPRNATEEALAEIWAEMLDLDYVGVHDHFLDLGGDSLLAVKILARARVRFRAAIPDEAFFAAETVAEMASVIAESPHFPPGDDPAT